MRRRIRNIAREADNYTPTERVIKIAGLFKYFKNPDKETVLTPWRVVNMHMSECLGGWDFFDLTHGEQETLDEPRFVDRDQVTKDVFFAKDAKILEINSKTGLYPLYVTYSSFRAKLEDLDDRDDISIQKKLWDETVTNNVFVICKTPMAKAITKRTLVGYSDIEINAHYLDDLISALENKSKLFTQKISDKQYWKKGTGEMHFDAIVGNPPYQSTTKGGIDNGKAAKQAKPVFQLFVEQAKALKPRYVSMIIPARWYNGGMNLDAFRQSMINDRQLVKLVDFYNAKDCFPTVEIAGGLCYFLWENGAEADCEVINMLTDGPDSLVRPLNEFNDLFVRSNKALGIINKVLAKTDRFVYEMASPLDTFGLSSKEKGHEKYKDGDIELLHSVGYNGQGISYIERSKVTKNIDLIDKYKIKVSIMIPQGGETGVQPENGYRSISAPQILPPGRVDTFSYLNVAFFDTEIEAQNFLKYLTGKFARFMMRTTFSSVHLSRANFIFVPALDFNEEWLDSRLYDYYGLNDEERALIESTMRVIEL